MAIGWFICGYIVSANEKDGRMNVRDCAMSQFTDLIRADDGDWSEIEITGDAAVVKVRASDATLTTIGGTTGFLRITNHVALSDTLADLTNGQRNVIQNRLLSAGYTQAEIDAAMGSTLAQWRQHTFQDLVNLIATRRIPPRWDDALQQIVFDRPAISCTKSVNRLDAEVPAVPGVKAAIKLDKVRREEELREQKRIQNAIRFLVNKEITTIEISDKILFRKYMKLLQDDRSMTIEEAFERTWGEIT